MVLYPEPAISTSKMRVNHGGCLRIMENSPSRPIQCLKNLRFSMFYWDQPYVTHSAKALTAVRVGDFQVSNGKWWRILKWIDELSNFGREKRVCPFRKIGRYPMIFPDSMMFIIGPIDVAIWGDQPHVETHPCWTLLPILQLKILTLKKKHFKRWIVYILY